MCNQKENNIPTMKLKLFPKSQRWDGFPMKSKKKNKKHLQGRWNY